MSILLHTSSSKHRTSTTRSVIWFVGYFLMVIAGGVVIGWAVIPSFLNVNTETFSSFLPEIIDKFVAFILRKVQENPARALRRIQTALAIILAPWMLRNIGWQGFHDLGWQSQQSREARKQDFIRWFLIGVIAMGILFGIALISGVRFIKPFSFWTFAGAFFSGFLIIGIGVGIIEETLTRGVLYRSLARTWTPWSAAIVSSLLFAWAHFMKATPESFDQGLLTLLRSSLFADFAKEAVPLKFLNMFLFGMVLCRLVYQSGNIWGATGLHAAAVGMIKVFSKMTDFDRDYGYRTWIGGHSAKFDDGWMLALLLCLLLILVFRQTRNPSAKTSRVHF